MADATQSPAAEAQQARKKEQANLVEGPMTATYLGGEDERSDEQKDAGVKPTVEELGGRPLMGIVFKKGEKVPVVGKLIIGKLKTLELAGVFKLEPYDKKDGTPVAGKVYVQAKRDMKALAALAKAEEKKRRGSAV